MTAPLIGLTVWRRELDTYLGPRTDLYTLGTEYPRTVRRCGGLPVLLTDLDDDAVEPLLDRVDGLLLTGGGDVHPAEYGAPIPAEGDWDRGRDRLERTLVLGARRRRLPVFGICRGLQILAVSLGGTLVADLPATATHPTPPAGADLLAVRHGLLTDAAWPTAGLGTGRVNSIHHQAVATLAPGLRAVGWAPDGTVEAIEGTDPDWFVRAVQWHPEKMTDAGETGHGPALLAPLVAAADEYARRRREPVAAAGRT